MIKGMFKGLGNAETNQRLPDPKPGIADFLVDQIRFKENRNGGHRIAATLTCLRSVEGGNEKGDRVNYAIFSGDYFLKELKRLVLCLADVPAAEEDAIVEMMCPASNDKYKGMDDLARKELAWEMIASETCAIDENGQPTAAGAFDGQVVIRLETIHREGKPTGKWVKSASGEMVEEMGSGFTNVYPVKLIPLEEVTTFLDEKDLDRFFGGAEKFAQLLENE